MNKRRWIRNLASGGTALRLMFALAAAPLEAQQSNSARPPLTFEVATIKVVDPHTIRSIDLRVLPGGHLVVHAHRLAMLIAEAFNIPEQEIVGGTESVMQGWYDVEAKSPENLQATMPSGEYSEQGIQDARIRSMLQALVIERFHLTFHIANHSGTVYQLKRSDGPLRLQPVAVSTQAPGTTKAPDSSDMSGTVNLTGGMPLELRRETMPQLARLLSKYQQAPVIDETSLPGSYNFKSKTLVTNEDFLDGNLSRVLLSTVPEMGLRLIKAKGMLEEFVIDNVEPVATN